MRVDILNEQYIDPFEFDIFQNQKLEEHENRVLGLLQEKKKRRKTESSVYEDPETRKGFRRVNLGNPWDGDQSLYWPDYEAEAFEKALDQFKVKQPDNSGGYTPGVLERIKDRYGHDFMVKTLEKEERTSPEKGIYVKELKHLRETKLHRIEQVLSELAEQRSVKNILRLTEDVALIVLYDDAQPQHLFQNIDTQDCDIEYEQGSFSDFMNEKYEDLNPDLRDLPTVQVYF